MSFAFRTRASFRPTGGVHARIISPHSLLRHRGVFCRARGAIFCGGGNYFLFRFRFLSFSQNRSVIRGAIFCGRNYFFGFWRFSFHLTGRRGGELTRRFDQWTQCRTGSSLDSCKDIWAKCCSNNFANLWDLRTRNKKFKWNTTVDCRNLNIWKLY